MAQTQQLVSAIPAGTPSSVIQALTPSALEAETASQALSAVSSAGGLAGVLPTSSRVIIRTPTTGLSVNARTPVPTIITTSPSLRQADPLSLPPVTGSAPGSAVVGSPQGVGVLTSVRTTGLPTLPVAVPPTPGLSPRSASILPPPSPRRSTLTPALPPQGGSALLRSEIPTEAPLGSVVASSAPSGTITTFPLSGGATPVATQQVVSPMTTTLSLPSSPVLPPVPPSSPVGSATQILATPVQIVSPNSVLPAVAPLPTTATTSPRLLTTTTTLPLPVETKTVTPIPSGNRVFANYSSAIKADSLDELLISKGYVRLDTITLDTERDKAFYVKAVNPVGDIVFIHVDRSGGLTVTLPGRTVMKVSEGFSIPHSTKVSAVQCAGSSVCGVAFQCEGELCVLQRRDEGKLYEGTFVVAETPADKRMTPVGSPVAYPIINLSEIESDPDNAIVRVRKATVEIQANVKATTIATLAASLQSSQILTERIALLIDRYQKMHQARDAEVKAALSLIDQYRAMPVPLSAENASKYKMLVDRLRNFNEEFVQLINFAGAYEAIQRQIAELTLQTNDAINSMFLAARRSYDPIESAALRDATQWGLPAELNQVTDYQRLTSGQWGVDVPETDTVKALRRQLGA